MAGGVLCASLLSCSTLPPPVPAAPPPAPAAPQPPPERKAPPGPLPRFSAAAPKVTRHTLENGLRLVVVEHHRRPLVTVSFVFPHGALNDPADTAGLNYMAVHLASDFYESMGVNDRQEHEESFRMRVSQLGGAARFEAGADDSLIQLQGYAQDTGTYVKMMEDATRKLRHGARSFRARRAAALDSLEELESEDPAALQQLVEQAAFGKGHPYARPVLGTPQSLNQMELQEVMDHQHLVFSPAGATLLVVGDVDPAAVRTAVSTWFDNWEGGNAPVPAVPRPELPRNGDEIGFLDRHAASTLFTCATRPLPEVAGNDATLRVLVAMLGQGFGHRLNASLREASGFTYGAYAEIVRRKQASALLACAALQGSSADQGVKQFRAVLQQMRERPPAEEELRRARALLEAELDASWEDVNRITATWLEAIRLGTGAPRLDEERAGLEKVTARDVQKLAQKIFRLETFRWVVSGERKAAAQAFEAPGLGKLKPFTPGG